MPAAFAHMIAANQAKFRLEKNNKLIKKALNMSPQWLQAGTVGPDYPYLHHALTSHDASDSWADLLHYKKTGDVVRAGVEIMRERYAIEKSKKDFLRALAWLFGYASHVIMDASVHPVVRAIVGEYDANKTEHRVCEMYMDSYIFKEIKQIELTNSEWADYLRHISDPRTKGMDSSVSSLWHEMLKTTYPQEYAANRPDIDGWQKEYVKKLDMADTKLILFRHAAAEGGLLYIESTEIPPDAMKKYIETAKTPVPNKFGTLTIHFKQVFDFGVKNVMSFWTEMADIIEGTGDPLFAQLPNWNLDKGTIDPTGEGYATLWV